jgi:hypothetical protein
MCRLSSTNYTIPSSISHAHLMFSLSSDPQRIGSIALPGTSRRPTNTLLTRRLRLSRTLPSKPKRVASNSNTASARSDLVFEIVAVACYALTQVSCHVGDAGVFVSQNCSTDIDPSRYHSTMLTYFQSQLRYRSRCSLLLQSSHPRSFLRWLRRLALCG